MSKDTLIDWQGLTPIDLKGNYIPFELFDKVFPRISTLAELKIVLFIVRRTVTFSKAEDWIAKTQFEDGMFDKKAGERLNWGCGLSRPSIDEGIRRAIDHNIIEERICCSHCGFELTRTNKKRKFSWTDREGERHSKEVVHNRAPDSCPNCGTTTQGKMQYFYKLVFKDNH